MGEHYVCGATNFIIKLGMHFEDGGMVSPMIIASSNNIADLPRPIVKRLLDRLPGQ